MTQPLPAILKRVSIASACSEFGMIISIKKTEITCQDTPASPTITISGATLAVVDDFKYLGSVISGNMSLDAEIPGLRSVHASVRQ